MFFIESFVDYTGRGYTWVWAKEFFIFEVQIKLKFNNNYLKFNGDFKSYITF